MRSEELPAVQAKGVVLLLCERRSSSAGADTVAEFFSGLN